MRPDPATPPEVGDLIRKALAGRVREVRELLRGMTPAAAAPAAAAPLAANSQPEESLRRLMASVLPTVRDAPGPGPVRARFFALLADLEPAARSPDLRFLDAWNNACEVLLTWPEEERARDDARSAFLVYVSLLEAHLARLGVRP